MTNPKNAMSRRFHEPLWVIHLALTLILCFFGFRLILPSDTFALGAGYSWFGGHWPYVEQRWGYLFLAMGTCGLPALVWTRSPWTQLIGAAVLSLAHALLAQGFYNGSAASTGWMTYATVAALGAYRFWMVNATMRPVRVT